MSYSKINTWIFDLDNTLYSSENGFLNQMDTHITNFLAIGQNISYAEACIVRDGYRKKYGTSLEGMVKEADLCPSDYYDYIANNLDYSGITPCTGTNNFIKNLSGRKIVYSNGEINRVKKVLHKLDMEDIFDGVYDITWANLIDKQYKEPYENLLKELKVSAKECIMFEDSHKNLKAPHELGMTTVLVHGEKEGRDYIHHAYPSLLDFLKENK